MPYIHINTTEKLDASQMEKIKSSLGQTITLIPGKQEKGLMVDFSDGHTMYLGGVADKTAFVEVHCFKKSEDNGKKAFVASIFDILEENASIPKNRVYVNFIDLDEWGAGGSLNG